MTSIRGTVRWAGLHLLGGLGALGLAACITGGSVVHPYRYSLVDVPISLAIGTMRTPVFSVADEGYFIMVQVEKPKRLTLSEFRHLACMMGTADTAPAKDCPGNHPLLRAEWTVWDQGTAVASGMSTTTDHAMATSTHLFKFIGNFVGKKGGEYVVEVRFTQDGTPLNASNPHLIVISERLH